MLMKLNDLCPACYPLLIYIMHGNIHGANDSILVLTSIIYMTKLDIIIHFSYGYLFHPIFYVKLTIKTNPKKRLTFLF